MKIKKFMKETDKKLKKHSYNARSIMEELNNSVTLMDVIKDPEINPDSFVNDEFKTTYYKKDKTTPEADIAALKRYDIIIKHDNHPWIGYYTGRTPEGSGIKISLKPLEMNIMQKTIHLEIHIFGIIGKILMYILLTKMNIMLQKHLVKNLMNV